ncbi:MAG: hypothetical protein ABIU05_14285, partial [Nitrospirales bacterium]
TGSLPALSNRCLDALRTGPALISEAVAALVSENEMVQESDAEQVGTLPESAGEDAILLAGRHISGRVIVGTDPGGGVHQDQRFKHFTRMHDGQGQGPD